MMEKLDLSEGSLLVGKLDESKWVGSDPDEIAGPAGECSFLVVSAKPTQNVRGTVRMRIFVFSKRSD